MFIQQRSTRHTGIRVSQKTLWVLWLIVSALTGLFTPTAYGKGDIEYDVNKAIITLHKYSTDLNPIYQHVTPENRQALLHKLTDQSHRYHLSVKKASSIEERARLALAQIHYYRQIDDIKIIEIKFKGQTFHRKHYQLYSDNTLILLSPLLYLGDTQAQLKLVLKALKKPSTMPPTEQQTTSTTTDDDEEEETNQEYEEWRAWERAWLDGGGFEWYKIVDYEDGESCGIYKDNNGDINEGHCAWF